jgi:PD-(D/E)XK endonuclease
MPRGFHPRTQGDFGELSAIVWLTWAGADVSRPLFHSPYYDLIADFDGRLLRVEVKTSNCRRFGRFEVTLATRGGNQSWNGVSKRLDRNRCDYVFAHVGDGRRWFIPVDALGGTSGLRLGGPKYGEYEIEPGATLPPMGGGGFEPPKAEPRDLQSRPFDRSGIPPGMSADDSSGGASGAEATAGAPLSVRPAVS